MNNSKLAIDSVSLELDEKKDIQPLLRQREQQLTKIIEAIEGVMTSESWSTLKTELFDALPKSLERGLKDEAKKESPDLLKLSRLAGKLEWAEKYADLSRLANNFRLELTGLRTKLYGKTE